MHETTLHAIDPNILVKSPNHRRRNWGDLQALATSLRDCGMVQPIVARRVVTPDGIIFEMIAGERRRVAAITAGLATVPVVLLELDDISAIEAQVAENLGREDLHPMDEAELYEMLLVRGMAVEVIAQRHAREPAHIRARLKLCGLCRKVRDAYLAGEVGHDVAFALARLPDAKAQEHAAKMVAEASANGGDALRVVNVLRERVMRTLSKAPFNREDPMLTSAGPCEECPFRSGAQRDMFPELAQVDDYCLRPECWGAKCKATWKVAVKAAAETGLRVVEGKEARALWDTTYAWAPTLSGDAAGMFVRADDSPSGELPHHTWRDLVDAGRVKAEAALVAGPDGEPVTLYRKDQATRGLKAILREERKSPAAEEVKRDSYKTEVAEDVRRDRAIRERRVEVEKRAAAAAAERCKKSLPLEFWPAVLLLLLDAGVHDLKSVAEDRGTTPVDLAESIAQMSAADARSLWVRLVCEEAYGEGEEHNPRLLDLFAVCEVDLDAIEVAVKASEKAEKRAAKAAAEK